MTNSNLIAENDLAYLCGCFCLETNISQLKLGEPWQRADLEKEKKEWALNSNFYYKYFIDLFYPHSITKSHYRQCDHYICPVNKELTYIKEKTVLIKEINLYILPFNFVVYTISVEQNGKNLNQNMECLRYIRNNSLYDSISKPFLDVLTPIVDLYNSTRHSSSPQIQTPSDYNMLTQNGDKLKVFHIVSLQKSSKETISDTLLFEIGTFDSKSNYSEEYFNQIISNNKLSIFSNWTALALFDTFTILSNPNIDENFREDFKLHYFKYIYLNDFYVRNFMFHANAKFRESNANIPKIEDEFKTFKHYFYFSRIAHNFSLQELHDKIDSSLKIEHEFNQLQSYLQDERQRTEKINEKRFNAIINIITFTTLFSAIWDGTCLIETITCCPPQRIAFYLISIVLVVLVFIRFRLSKKR